MNRTTVFFTRDIIQTCPPSFAERSLCPTPSFEDRLLHSFIQLHARGLVDIIALPERRMWPNRNFISFQNITPFHSLYPSLAPSPPSMPTCSTTLHSSPPPLMVSPACRGELYAQRSIVAILPVLSLVIIGPSPIRPVHPTLSRSFKFALRSTCGCIANPVTRHSRRIVDV
jgi:hypothetical protein